jgi:hypothetical protein
MRQEERDRVTAAKSELVDFRDVPSEPERSWLNFPPFRSTPMTAGPSAPQAPFFIFDRSGHVGVLRSGYCHQPVLL